MKKKLVSMALICACMAVSASAAAWPGWALPAQDWAQQHGLDAAFLAAPLQPLTRGQTAQLLYEAAGQPAVTAETPFIDIPEQYEAAVTWAQACGLVQGVGGERYEPNRLVTRQEFAAILYRGDGSPDAAPDALAGFSDREQVAGWAQDAVCWCVETGLLSGKGAGCLAPQDPILAAEAALMLQRADSGPAAGDVLAVSSLDEIKAQLAQAIADAGQPPVFDVRALGAAPTLELDVRNLYYTILSGQPALKYAYDLQAELREDGLLYCTVSYMPYRTGAYPDGFQGTRVDSLYELIETARAHVQQAEAVPIRITDPSLTVDDMNRALQQVGGSYLLCQLNRDGTAITFTPQNQLTASEAVQRLQEIDRLADQVIASQVTDTMTDAEKAQALYTYVTEAVAYDQRYYSDPAHMPYDSQTAYGALHDGLAICGGYAQAVQVLFEKQGIPCYTVSGRMGGEYHMWNIACLDGTWLYFDATSDRGRAGYWFNYFGVQPEQLTNYTWDQDWVQRLIQAE